MATFETTVQACAGSLGLTFSKGAFPDLGPYFKLTGADNRILLVSPRLDILTFWLDGFAHGVAASQAGATGARGGRARAAAVRTSWREDELDGES